MQRREQGLQQEICTGAFSVTSIDNIDRAAPGKRITPTNQNRGFHGTSVQHVAPKPLSEVLKEDEVPANPKSSAAPASIFSGSFIAPRTKRRPHTLKECQQGNCRTATPEHVTLPTAVDPSCIAVTSAEDLQHYQIRLYHPSVDQKPALDEAAVAVTVEESEEIVRMQEAIFNFMMKQAIVTSESRTGLKDYLTKLNGPIDREKSSLTTLAIIPESADNLDSLKSVLDSVYNLYGIGTHQHWHTVVGDQKLFSAMQRLKRLYGAELDWLLPYTGDWHIMKNFQSVLSKLYFHAGLRELAASAGYKGSNLTGLELCTNYKHTHVFLLEVFESVYIHAIQQYLSGKHAEVVTFQGFSTYLDDLVASSHTGTLWTNLLHDVGMYVMFWLSLRCPKWHLRQGSFKMMARLFHAFDRQFYTELCAQHLADIWQLPPAVKQHFANGAFTVSVLGISNHDQALDEAHESVVNRQTKGVLQRADAEYIKQIAHYLPYRARLQENLRKQVIDLSDRDKVKESTCAHPGNVSTMCSKLAEAQPFRCQGDLQNVFSGQTATPAEQRGI